MHLFITPSVIDGDQITIQEPRILKHAKVMRLGVGEIFLVQEKQGDLTYRRKVRCVAINKKNIIGTISDTTQKNKKEGPLVITAVPLPNTLSKLDLIVQKLTEIGVDKIVLWPAQRSQIRTLSDNKLSKLRQISLESSQQAKSRYIPHIEYVKNIQNYCTIYTPIVLNQGGITPKELFMKESIVLEKETSGYICIMGPEGGLTKQDYTHIGDTYTKIDLGEGILRMETAAWIGSRIVKNLSS